MRILVCGGTKTVKRLMPTYANCLGVLSTPRSSNRLPRPGVVYAADNGCYKGLDRRLFIRMIYRMKWHSSKPLWVACPDVVANADATNRLWWQWAGCIMELGLVPCYVLQDGCESIDIPIASAYFIGGSTEFKLSSTVADIAASLKKRGALLHMGRVNTDGRLGHAMRIGCDTVDGSAYSMWGDTLLSRALQFVQASM